MANTYSATLISATKLTVSTTFPAGRTSPLNVNDQFTANLSSTDVTKAVYKSYTIGTSGTVLDLNAIVDANNATINFASIKHIQITNNGSVGVTIGGGTTPLLAALPITAGGCVNLTSTITVTGSSNNLLKLITGSSTASVDVIILGA